MVSKLGLHRTVNLTDLTAEHDLVKLGHHPAGTERAKVAALGEYRKYRQGSSAIASPVPGEECTGARRRDRPRS